EFAASCGGTFAGPPGDCEGLSSTSPSTFPSTLNPRQLPRVGNGSSDKSLQIGLVSLAFGIAFLVGLFLLDRERYAGLATAFVVPTALALVTGTETLGNAAHHAWVGGLLTLVAGLAFGLVGHLGARRFTTWFGAVMLGLGAVTMALDFSHISRAAVNENVKLIGPGLLVILFGVLLVAGGVALSVWLTRPLPPRVVPGPPPGVPPGPG